MRRLALLALIPLSVVACEGSCAPPTPPVPAEGIFAPLGEVRPSATAEERETFARGREVALKVFSEHEGLGPGFNVTSCAACHEKPDTGGSAGRYRNFLLVQQHRPNGEVMGVGMNGVQHQYVVGDGVRARNAVGANVTATRNPIPFFGVGLLAEIPEDEILARVDEDDANGDGVSGRANFDRGFVGRFGRKSQTASIEGFVRGPLNNHAGITSDPLPYDRRLLLPLLRDDDTAGTPSCGGLLGCVEQGQAAAPEDDPLTDNDAVPDPELAEDELFDLVAFTMLLAAPAPEPLTAPSRRGRGHFDVIGCTACHVPALNGPRGLIPAYSDLLLHDMGDALADGIVQLEASGSEFRTQPLWGIAAVGPYLHDGRADTLDEAIRAHGGEGARSRDAYAALDEEARGDVIAFLESLGGRAQQSEGLVPPQTPCPEPGALGGPRRALVGDEEPLFLDGRAVFDREVPLAGGLGPAFNGDSCRACHFQAGIGGGGPLDVNVIRYALIDDDGVVSEPAGGTMAPLHHVDPTKRPSLVGGTAIFEARQTPAVFGLGLIDEVRDDAIRARADPDDHDGDGVRGVARELPDGRVGRFGWKAGVPSLAEFARDAMSNELGVTVPEVPGLTFGRTTDDDAAADPEIDADALGALVFFMGMIAPPPVPADVDLDVVARGRQAFSTARCDACHVPTSPTVHDDVVTLYSDLLLHDVALPDHVGVPDGDVDARLFRTAPLLGLRVSAPYLHDGRAATLEEAIVLHGGEAEASFAAYAALSAADQAALLAFLGAL